MQIGFNCLIVLIAEWVLWEDVLPDRDLVFAHLQNSKQSDKEQ